ncbi:Fe-S cluster assembly [Chlorella sorokiniana]|uniref:Fe-S cluster assembly n=1 Tax=Chlorella sorokiniana TaxID=3076 RepID=A0A2P6TWK2_CHLSO|nr:Fe-S cluster assembly [Chlorella sorokiniana]|eukprot:PRW58445.1 Fe-S cluster assembly [Chlorella sorokiniana]
MAAESQYTQLLDAAVQELQRNVGAAEGAAAALVERLVAAAGSHRRIAVYGVGREGLAMKGFAMRLYHMGLQASVVGDMTAARLGPGDLLLMSAGPGIFATVQALCGVATAAGATTLALTSQPGIAARLGASQVLHIPATCMAAEEAGDEATTAVAEAGAKPGAEPAAAAAPPSPLLLGSSYELALQLFFDLVCAQLVQRLQLSPEQLAARHTNLE